MTSALVGRASRFFSFPDQNNGKAARCIPFYYDTRKAAKAVSDGWAKFGLETERCKFLATTELPSLSVFLPRWLKLSKLSPSLKRADADVGGREGEVCSSGKKPPQVERKGEGEGGRAADSKASAASAATTAIQSVFSSIK